MEPEGFPRFQTRGLKGGRRLNVQQGEIEFGGGGVPGKKQSACGCESGRASLRENGKLSLAPFKSCSRSSRQLLSRQSSSRWNSGSGTASVMQPR